MHPEVIEGRDRADASFVEQHIEPAKPLLRQFDQSQQGYFIRDCNQALASACT